MFLKKESYRPKQDQKTSHRQQFLLFPLIVAIFFIPLQELYRKDCNLAAQLLQCNKSLYRAQLSEVSHALTFTGSKHDFSLESTALYLL